MATNQQRIDAILSGRGTEPEVRLRAEFARVEPRPLFSAFVDTELQRAFDLSQTFARIADESGIDRAIAAIEEQLKTEPMIGLVQYAVKLFLTHSAEARNQIKLKPLEVRQPDLVRPSRPLLFSGTSGTGTGQPPSTGGPSGPGATPPEDRLGFWREDPLINEHHEHWHLVYPTSSNNFPKGPKPKDGYPLGDRHGELFFYMHQQMIARYDVERIAVHLPHVVPFAAAPLSISKFATKIPEGYDPGPLKLWDDEKPYQFRARPANAAISDLTLKEPPPAPDWSQRVGAKLADQVTFGNNLLQAAHSGTYALLAGQPVTADNLGNETESNVNALDYYANPDPKNHKIYGNFHNDGHIHFMLFDNAVPYGVMASTSTAIRDPVFFRWHKLVDNIYDDFQQKQTPHDFSNGPKVGVRKRDLPNGHAASIDIILCLEDQLPASIAGHKFGSRAYNTLAGEAFSHSANPHLDRWNVDFTATRTQLQTGEIIETTDELLTEMRTRKINLEQGDGKTIQESIEYLSHDDFYYFLRVENLLPEEQTVAVRIFLAPESEITDRRMWIELDRFAYRLKASEKAVIFRPADQSSVVRKPVLRPDDLTADDGATSARVAQPWCDCGWPYTVLLPRGTKTGMDFRLLVMMSRGNDLIMPDHPECCTSISYCGLQDLQYPDKTPMGYPLDRPFSNSIRDTVAKAGNWSWRTIRIRCKNL